MIGCLPLTEGDMVGKRRKKREKNQDGRAKDHIYRKVGGEGSLSHDREWFEDPGDVSKIECSAQQGMFQKIWGES